MKKLIFILLFSAFSQGVFADTLTITTYYPAPYGAYRQLASQTLGVGDNNNDNVLNANDAPNPNDPNQFGDVWIRGKVGIGTTTPQARLEVNKTLRLTPRADLPFLCNSDAVAGSVYYDDSGNKAFQYCNGTKWKKLGSAQLGSSGKTRLTTLSYGEWDFRCKNTAIKDNPIDCPPGSVLTGIEITKIDHCPESCHFGGAGIKKISLICRPLE